MSDSLEVEAAGDRFSAILERYIAKGDLSDECEVEVKGAVVIILNIVVPKRRRRKGIAKRFLAEAKAAGVAIDICQPKESSLPFWENMHARGLILHNPHEYTTWESS